MKTKIDDVVLIDIPKIVDPKGRGKLSRFQKETPNMNNFLEG